MKIRTATDSANANYTITQLLETPGGFEKFAAEQLPTFIRETRDYEAFGRSVLLTHQITGEQCQMIGNEPYFYYAKDMNSHAAFFNDDGMIPRLQIEGEGVNVGIMNITSDDTQIFLKRLLVQRYNYLERTRELSGQAIAKLEDNKILDLVNALLMGDGNVYAPAEIGTQIVVESGSQLTKNGLVSLKQKISQHNIPCGNYVMNTMRVDDVLKWGRDEIDQLTQREIMETGAKYKIFGDMKLITSPIINIDEVYLFAEKEYVGRMPILKDLTLKLTETANKLVKGLFMYEFLGIYLASHKAVAKLVLNYSTKVTNVGSTLTSKPNDAFRAGAYAEKLSDGSYELLLTKPADWDAETWQGNGKYYPVNEGGAEAAKLIRFSSVDVEGALARPTQPIRSIGALEGSDRTRSYGGEEGWSTSK
jgi:hypothetical protein